VRVQPYERLASAWPADAGPRLAARAAPPTRLRLRPAATAHRGRTTVRELDVAVPLVDPIDPAGQGEPVGLDSDVTFQAHRLAQRVLALEVAADPHLCMTEPVQGLIVIAETRIAPELAENNGVGLPGRICCACITDRCSPAGSCPRLSR
jgi:hypothetical protein